MCFHKDLVLKRSCRNITISRFSHILVFKEPFAKFNHNFYNINLKWTNQMIYHKVDKEICPMIIH